MSRRGIAMTRVVAIAASAACGGKPAPPAASHVAPALSAALAAADRVRAPWRCAALDTPRLADEAFATGPRRWRLADHALRRADADDELVIGVVADAGGGAPATLAALARLRVKLDAASADLVLALGGMGDDTRALEATLGTLATGAAWPVVVVAADLEPATAVRDVTTALRARGSATLDGRLVRWIELPGATIAIVPGAGARGRLVAGDDGCAWRDDDVAGVFGELAKRPGVRIGATAEAPREVVAGEPTGELALVAGADRPIDVALHGTTTAGPSATAHGGRDGNAIALSPGSSDATPRPDAQPRPTAGVLVVKGAAWTWRSVRDDD